KGRFGLPPNDLWCSIRAVRLNSDCWHLYASLPQLLIADKALRGSPSTFSHCLTTNLLTVLRINSVSVILCRKVPSRFLILCHDYAINEAVNLPLYGQLAGQRNY